MKQIVALVMLLKAGIWKNKLWNVEEWNKKDVLFSKVRSQCAAYRGKYLQ